MRSVSPPIRTAQEHLTARAPRKWARIGTVAADADQASKLNYSRISPRSAAEQQAAGPAKITGVAPSAGKDYDRIKEAGER